jgi:catechol 2,3-dioxygenase-like lactoylglutathione lyase family enzyme
MSRFFDAGALRDYPNRNPQTETVLGMAPLEERPGKWSLQFGVQKISLQDVGAAPAIAKGTVPGSGNFCLLTEEPIGRVVTHLESQGVQIVDGPGERLGASGTIMSVYFHDPDGNLVEVSNPM